MLGIYACIDDNYQVMYVGSSEKDLDQLEWNHRNYFKFPNGYESLFRAKLRSDGANWKFKWIQQPRDISRMQCEIEEGALIRYLHPLYNVDKYPYETSVQRGRMKQI